MLINFITLFLICLKIENWNKIEKCKTSLFFLIFGEDIANKLRTNWKIKPIIKKMENEKLKKI